VALLIEQQKKRWTMKGVILTLTLTLSIALVQYYFLWYSLQGVIWHGTISKVTLWSIPFFLKRRRAAFHCIREKKDPHTTPSSHTKTGYESQGSNIKRL
jgi:hypothetical protein